MRFTPPSVGTVAPGNAPGGGKEAGRRAQHRGQPSPPAAGRRALAQRARAARRLFLRPQPAPTPPGAAGSLAPSFPRRNIPGWALVRLLTRPARPAPPTRPHPEAEGAVPAVAGAWPRPVAGLRVCGAWGGVGGCGAASPHPLPTGAHRRSLTVPRTLVGSSPGRPVLGYPAPCVPAAPSHRDPLTLSRLLSSFMTHCPSCSGLPFRSLN